MIFHILKIDLCIREYFNWLKTEKEIIFVFVFFEAKIDM